MNVRRFRQGRCSYTYFVRGIAIQSERLSIRPHAPSAKPLGRLSPPQQGSSFGSRGTRSIVVTIPGWRYLEFIITSHMSLTSLRSDAFELALEDHYLKNDWFMNVVLRLLASYHYQPLPVRYNLLKEHLPTLHPSTSLRHQFWSTLEPSCRGI